MKYIAAPEHPVKSVWGELVEKSLVNSKLKNSKEFRLESKYRIVIVDFVMWRKKSWIWIWNHNPLDGSIIRVVPDIRLAGYPAFFISGIRPDIRFHLPDIRLTGYPVKLMNKWSELRMSKLYSEPFH